jgi:DNA-binding MarR family transcriptional regulator
MKTKGQPDDAWSRFAMSIFYINGLLMRAGDSITQPIGQSSARWQVIVRIGYGSQTVANMARDIGHARQSVQRVADVLEKEGLVVYKDHPTDRRTRLLELTPEGKAALMAIYLRQLEWSQRIMANLNPNQLVEIADTLEGIGQIVEKGVHVSTEED